MNSSTTSQILHATPSDPTPDRGPRHRSDAAVWFFTIVLALAAITLTVLGIRMALDAPNMFYVCWIPLVALGAPAAYGAWSIYSAHRARVEVPRSHAVLAGELGFDLLATCRGVAATAFFVPDTVVHGGTTRLLLFLENYMSRQRIVTARFGHLPGIGRPHATIERLHLAAGQAAVYSLPVQIAPDIPAGFHRLSVTLRAEQPEGVGQRLQSARTRIRNMNTLRFAAPFEVAPGRPIPPGEQIPLPAPRYITLASVTEKTPDLTKFHELLAQT